MKYDYYCFMIYDHNNQYLSKKFRQKQQKRLFRLIPPGQKIVFDENIAKKSDRTKRKQLRRGNDYKSTIYYVYSSTIFTIISYA